MGKRVSFSVSMAGLFALGALAAPASGSEVLAIPAKAAVTGETMFVPGERYLVTFGGTITLTQSDGTYTFDPFYYQSQSSRPEIQSGLDMYFGADRQGPSYFSSQFGDAGWPAYRANHRYSFIVDSRFPEGRATWEALPFWSAGLNYAGAFRVEIVPLCDTARSLRGVPASCEQTYKTGFRFTQKGVPIKGKFEVVSGGGGNVTTVGDPDKSKDPKGGFADGSIVHKTDLEVGKVSFKGPISYGDVEKTARGRTISLEATSRESDDPTCQRESPVNVYITDARDPHFDSLQYDGQDGRCKMQETFRPSKKNKLTVKIFAPEKADETR